MHPTLFLLSFRLPQPGSNFVQYKFRNIMDLSDITRLISSLRAQTARDSITPNGLGSILQRIVDAISSMSGIDVEDEEAILQRLSAAESNASTALQAAQNAQAGAAGNVIDSFTQSKDEDEVSLSIKQHGHSAKQVVLPAASSTGAGIMTATDKSHLDTAYGKRVNLMSAPSSESVVTLTITFGDGTTKSVTFVGATAGTGGKAGLMTKEQADQLAALVAAGTAESVRDDAGYLKQQYAAPIILRNVTDTVFDDLAIGDVYYDTGHLFYHAEGASGDLDIGAPSRKVIYYCLADQTLYRWTGSRFVQAVSISSGDVTVPTKLSDLVNDMGFLTAHQPLKTINGQTITGTGNITIDGAAELKDASNHIKQNSATPVVLRNVADTMLDDLNEGDVYFDSGHLFWHTESTSGDIDLGTPSKRLIYFSIANSDFYRWTGSRFTKATDGSVVKSITVNGQTQTPDGNGNVNIEIEGGGLSKEDISVETQGDGTVDINVKDDTYKINLNHTHEGMAKLVVDTAANLPDASEMESDTIYGELDDGEIATIYLGGYPFYSGGGGASSGPVLRRPADGATIDMGQTTSGTVSKTINVKGKSLTQALIIQLTGTGYSFGTTQPSGVTRDSATQLTIPASSISAVNSLNGVDIVVVYTGSDTDENASGTLGITSASPDSISTEATLVANKVVLEDLAGVKLTGTQWLQTDYKPNAATEFVLNCKFSENSMTRVYPNNDLGTIFHSNKNSGDGKSFKLYFGSAASNYLTGTFMLQFVNESSIMNGSIYQQIMYSDSPSSNQTNFCADNSVVSYSIQTSNGLLQFSNAATTKSVNTSKKSSAMENDMKIGYDGTNIMKVFDLTIYELKIIEGGTVVRDWVPKKKNGVTGLLDIATNGTGTFLSSETAKTSGLASDELVAIPLT